MTYHEFKTTFPVGASIRIFERKPRHVVGYHESENVVVLKWRRGKNYGWEYEVMTSGEMRVWQDSIKNV